ncbi:uncharacterized protein BJ212DRAFT_1300738 [Suillus subaureus]|uniref:TPX2 C-terminal domain-containing protein n=1 Tax=Suillus subaureus TaxID=48587 RepID=A0A9P7E8H9_9AGAM|nr:uncharacterized protein BJ212DRAFT_1300738 [Suillus subaureus]KAG1813841.1 hypothetical protein BJ212DRAFT_1300738 [Suillus subaureus]
MPPIATANTELSTRHLPDLSDTSVSFQIPVDSSSAEFLLADNSSDLDFLCGAGGASFATIAPTPVRGQLRLGHITPKATSQLLSLSRSPSPSSSTHQKNDHGPLRFRRQSPVKANKMSRLPSKLKEIVLDGPAVSEERLESLRAEVGTLNDDYDISMQPPAVARSSVFPVLNVTAVPNSKLKPRTRINSAVEGGRNTKLATQSRIPMSAADKLGPASIAEPTVQSYSTWTSESGNVAIDIELQVPPASMSGVSNMVSNSSQSVTGRVAERLVSYSQKLMTSISIYNPRTENSFTAGTGTGVARTEEHIETQPPPEVDVVHALCSPDALSRNDYLLRLSEISPQKYHTQASASPGHLSTGRRELSSMRPARKRPATEEDSASQQPSGSKKFKAKPLSQSAVAKTGPTNSMRSSSQILRPSTQKNRAHGSVLISRNSRCPTSKFPSARTKYKPRQNFQRQVSSTSIASTSLCGRAICKEKDKNVQGQEGGVSTSCASQSRTSGSSRVHFDAGHVVSKKPVAVTGLERLGQSRPGLVPPLEKTLPPANITKPIAFTFHMDARVEARKAEFEKLAGSVNEERGHRQRHPVPDFKVLHEAHQASLAWRKEHIIPIVPAPPIVLSTEIRAREREKFDQMMRIKEEEIQQAKEERRRQRDAEEEREIKELRKRAIPKANEIPEWYADMPKKGGSVGGSG